jgi:MFS family permease
MKPISTKPPHPLEEPAATMASAHKPFTMASLKPPPYVLCAIFTSIGGFVFGFDTGSIGPITLMEPFTATFGTLTPTIQGLVVSSILIPGALSSFFAGPIADRISRTFAISLGGALFSVGALICALSRTLPQLFVGRIISGLGEGIFLSCINVYSLEIAPRRIRGTVACVLQLLITLGICCGYFVCYACLGVHGGIAWRTPFIVQTIVAATLAVGSPWIPHSPRWLLMRARRAEAEQAAIALGIDADERRELLMFVPHAEDGAQMSGWRKALEQYKAAWAKEVRGRTALAVYMQGTQNLSGIDGVLYYAPMLFMQAGLTNSKASFLASGVTGIVNVVFTAVAQVFTDRW